MEVYKNCFAGVLEKVGIEPQVQRIGKYKSAGDQLTRKTMSEENCEMLTALLDNIYGNWLDKVSSTKGTFLICGWAFFFKCSMLFLVLFEFFSQEREKKILRDSLMMESTK